MVAVAQAEERRTVNPDWYGFDPHQSPCLYRKEVQYGNADE